MNLMDRIVDYFRRKKYKKDFFKYGNVLASKKEVKILGPVYFLGFPKIIISGKCVIYPNVYFNGDGEIHIGDNVGISQGCTLYSSKQAGITIGNNVGIAANTYIIDCDHGIEQSDVPIMAQQFTFGKIIIGNNVWIADNCTILKNTIVSDGCVLGAKTLIRNIVTEQNSIYVGVPAAKKKTRK